MIQLKIADPTKIEIAKITQYFKGNLNDTFLKEIFSIEYLLHPL